MKDYFIQFDNFINKIKRIDMSDFMCPNMTNSEFFVLKIISDKSKQKGTDSVWISEIVDEVQVTAQAISKCLRLMENKRFIERFVNTDDRRVTGVRMLSGGKIAYETARNEILKFMENIEKGFEEEECREFVRLSTKFEKLFIENLNLRMQQKQMNGGQ